MPYVSLRTCILITFVAVAWLMMAKAIEALLGLPLALDFLLSVWVPPIILVFKRLIEQKLGVIYPLN
jgi:hypothetical protein